MQIKIYDWLRLANQNRYKLVKIHRGSVIILCLYVGFRKLLSHAFIQVGVLPMDESKVTMKGRLGPGMMISVDLESGQVGAPDHADI